MILVIIGLVLWIWAMCKMVDWYDNLYKHDYYYRWLRKIQQIKKSLKINKRRSGSIVPQNR